MKAEYTTCKLCIFSECDCDYEWFCSKRKEKLTKIWGREVNCEEHFPLWKYHKKAREGRDVSGE